MPDTPPFAIRFQYRPSDAELGAGSHGAGGAGSPHEGAGRAIVYRQALAFTARAFAVTELAATERFHLRDQLDRKASMVPQLVAQGLALADMHARRVLYVRARQAVTDCAAILDILGERGTVDLIALAPAAALALALLDTLGPLTAPPLRVR